MNIELGIPGLMLELHSGIFWNNQFNEAESIEDEFVDLDGVTCVQYTTLVGGKKIVLEAKGSETTARSYWTHAQLQQIKVWERSKITLTLNYGSISMTVRVPPNSCRVTPLRDMGGHGPDDIYFGEVTLMEVIQ